MPKFDTYIFDVDGTLAHTNKLIFETFRYVADKYLSKSISDDEIIALFGPTEDVILKDWMQGEYETAREDYFDFYTNEHDEMVTTFDGLFAVIEQLKSNNKHLAVFTGKGRDSTRITLDKLGLTNYFDLIVTGDDVKNHKPAADGLLKITNHFKINSEDALMIGDSPHDVTASKTAEVPIAAVLWDSYAADKIPSMKPEFIFRTVEEFKKFINSTL